jgi:hypothetical protein
VKSAALLLAATGCVTGVTVTQHATLARNDLAPGFTLPSQDGAPVSLAGALATGPVVLVFYRGFW